MNRNLDGCYFRVERDGKWQNICFSDLIPGDERDKVMKGRSAEWLMSLCCHLADTLRCIGDTFDIVNRYGGNDTWQI